MICFVWFCLILTDFVWFNLILSDFVWFCLILSDFVSFCLILFQFVWFCFILFHFILFCLICFLGCTCHQYVSEISVKCLTFCNILPKTITNLACQTCVKWRNKDRPTLTKVRKLLKNLWEVYFHSFVKVKIDAFYCVFYLSCWLYIIIWISLIYFSSSFI